MARSATLSAQVANVVRPWGLLTFLLLAYAAYTIQDAWQPAQRAIAQLAAMPQISLPPLQQLFPLHLEAPRVVLKCMAGKVTTYSDQTCGSGQDAEAILLED